MTTFKHEGCEWYVNDTRGYLDEGPSCDECGACGCDPCAHEVAPIFGAKHGAYPSACYRCNDSERECIGLAVAYVCLDGGDALCRACAEKVGLPCSA